MARESEKPAVFRFLFNQRYDQERKSLSNSTVTQGELQDAILALKDDEGLTLATGNPANFLKDFLRSNRRNDYWPEEIAAEGFTARQTYSESRVFDFVPYEEGQSVPFPDDFTLPDGAELHRIESISMASAARSLGGKGSEAWLIQVCVQQRLLETHFALHSNLDVIDLFHLQNSLKGTPEIDAVFLLHLNMADGPKKALLTLEAKRGDPVLPDQIKSQIARMARQTVQQRGGGTGRRQKPQGMAGLAGIDFILPVAAATFDRNGQRIIGIFEMEMVSVEDGVAAYEGRAVHDIPLVISMAVAYTLVPPVPGV